MANVKISELPAASGLNTTDIVPVTQSGTTARTTGGAFTDTMTGFIASGIGTGTPAARTVQAKLRELRTSEDFTGVGAKITGFGYSVFSGNTTGSGLTAVGYACLNANTTGTGNAAFGDNALERNTSGSLNTAIGSGALALTTTGSGNTAVGLNALNQNAVGGANNTAVGNAALVNNTSGTNNTAIGDTAAGANTSANNNVAVGSSALSTNLIGTGNTACGTDALSLTTGSNNVGVGLNCLFDNAGGDGNAGVGYQAGRDTTSGDLNTYLGYNTGRGITTGSNNTIVGASVSGLAAGTAGNVILAQGDGTIQYHYNGTSTKVIGTNFGNSFTADSSVAGQIISTGFFQSAQGSGTSSYTHFFFTNGNGNIGSISTDTSTTAYNTSSDQRLKNDKGIASSTGVLKNTAIHEFEWKHSKRNDKNLGVFAQEAVNVKPEAIFVGDDSVDKSGKLLNPWGVDYSKYVPDLIVGWQSHEKDLVAIKLHLGIV